MPRDHPLLRIRDLLLGAELDGVFADAYDRWNGRPCHPPSRVFRILFLQYFANLRDREVVEQVAINLLYREFVGLGWDENPPDASVLSRFRTRVGPQRIENVLKGMVEKARKLGLLDNARRVVDGTHIKANVAKRSRRELLASGRRHVLNALRGAAPDFAESLAKRFPAVRPTELSSSEARFEEERARTAAFLAEIEGKPFDEEVARGARLLRRVALEENPDRIVSFDDLDARFGHKTEEWTFTGYKSHEEIDPKSRLITAVDVIPGNENEPFAGPQPADLRSAGRSSGGRPRPAHVGELLDREPGGLPPGAAVVGDAAYTNEPCHRAIRERGGEPVSPRMKIARQVDRFSYLRRAEARAPTLSAHGAVVRWTTAPAAVNDRLICQTGKTSIARTRQENGTLHQFSMKDCATCPLAEQCLRPSEIHGSAQKRARVWVGEALRPKLAAGEAGAEHRKRCYAERYKVEALFAEQKGPRSRLGIARYWGIVKTQIQALLTAIATNASRDPLRSNGSPAACWRGGRGLASPPCRSPPERPRRRRPMQRSP